MQEQSTTRSDASQASPPDAALRLRDQHTEVTRRAILEAARAVFGERGYAQTSVRLLAERAGVAVQTIYSAFGSKPGVLKGLLDWISQDVDVRELASRLSRTDDPDEMIDLAARLLRLIRERGGDVLRMLRQGIYTDPELAEVFEAGFSRHRDGIVGLCRTLAAKEHLRPDLPLEFAIATALAVTSIDAYEEVVNRRGWTYDQYERWIADTLRSVLLSR